MSKSGRQQTVHEITVSAPAEAVYRLIAEVENWPALFPPTVHVEVIERTAAAERISIWATANGEAKSWTSRRNLDPGAMRIEFRQEVSAPPVAEMGGTWVIEPISAGRSKVELFHDFRALDDDPAGIEWIESAVERNSRSELAALKRNAELLTGGDDRLLSFEDVVLIDGAVEDVYAFINEADRWAQRLPHVARVELREDVPGLQLLAMDTRTKDGSTHTTESVRVCFPDRKVVYKQTTLPALMSLHTGYWTFVADGSRTVATSQHTVVINTDNIAGVLGADADLPKAREFVRTALSTNSTTTLRHAKEHAEQVRRAS
ncbi:aromatase/cyclase [Saccharopolyspora indica]|uniref:aromatase/cyclase n=1 Tax=Saccharopolyspora indica TaxID=1229659 RepID=UPI0022EB9D16|nr:aromatase/cyclase [Saccharopolyspora indica]MDA3645736.1 aromatase/cyclase [Saccharopolyspora indica]